jgi:hypothetical protein
MLRQARKGHLGLDRSAIAYARRVDKKHPRLTARLRRPRSRAVYDDDRHA